jgi:hypothetical protein
MLSYTGVYCRVLQGPLKVLMILCSIKFFQYSQGALYSMEHASVLYSRWNFVFLNLCQYWCSIILASSHFLPNSSFSPFFVGHNINCTYISLNKQRNKTIFKPNTLCSERDMTHGVN